MQNIKLYNNRNIFYNVDKNDLAAFLIIIVFSLLACFVFIATDGNLLAAIGLITVISILLITFYRVDWGFYTFISMVLLFDQFHIPEANPITYQVDYFKNLKQIPYVPHFSAGVMNPVELQLILMLMAWFVAISVRKQTKIQHVTIWGLALIMFITLIISFLHGLSTGGIFLPALWELRALFYFGFLYFFVPQIIQTKEQLINLMWVFIIFITVKALQGVGRFVLFGFSFNGLETLTNHEDPVFITLLIIFLLSLILFGGNIKQRNTLLILFAPLVLGFFAGQRRAAYGGLFISFIAFIILLQSHERLILLKAISPFLILIIIYSAIFWNSESKFAEPVKLIKSGISSNKSTEGERYLSNLYRKFEKYDLAVTSRSSLLLGLGFGKKYKMPIPLANIPFPLRDYIPHDEILWLFVKTGTIGFFIFFFFLDSLIIQGSTLCTKLNDPYLKSICVVIVVAIINQVVISYYDLQLTYYRNMIVLGTLCGLLPTLSTIHKNKLGKLTESDKENPDKKIVEPEYVN